METKLIIDNQHVSASGGATYARVHPINGTVVTTAAAGKVEDAVKAADSAAAAFKS
jgi:acyl-CoA reductase-like NAD-dependent aldehyde dehydrogenase